MRVALTDAAEEDLAAVYASYAGRSGPAADQVVGAILRAINGLALFPRMGGPGAIPETRERIVTRFPYRIVYHINERAQVVEAWRIIHTRLELPPSTGG
ncbi:MAG: type II toxin-antitoxin system RelE/ParE family toxin [Chloroflexota bacterium]